jgi:hypothetical protein
MSRVYWNQWSHAEIAALHGADEMECEKLDFKMDGYTFEQVLMPYDIDMLTARDFL